MSTPPAPTPAPIAPPPQPQEIRIYSHTNIFYWWPVWIIGFIMALVTYLSGQVLAIVPDKTKAHQNRELVWEEKDKTRDVLVVPSGKHLPTDKEGNPLDPHLRISNQKNVGVLFCTVLLLIIFITNVHLRGLWSVLVIGTIIFLVIIFALLGWWDVILSYLGFLDIRINLGGYIFISLVLFIIWLAVILLYDRRIYMVFTPGQFKVHLQIGGGEIAFDTAGMKIEKKPNDLFRYLLGMGSGDLIVRTSGAQPETFDLPNVLFLGSRVREIEELLRSRQVVPGPA